MNTYIVPYFDGGKCSIYSTAATNYRNAESKVIKYFVNRYDLDINYLDEDLKDIVSDLQEQDIYLGPLYDKDEF